MTKQGKYRDLEKRREYRKKWLRDNKDKTKESWRKWYTVMRRKCLEVIGSGAVKCNRCGENDYSKLQINHINGGGRQDKLYRSDKPTFFRKIIKGERKGEFNILCQACNYLHLAEMLSGKKYKEVD